MPSVLAEDPSRRLRDIQTHITVSTAKYTFPRSWELPVAGTAARNRGWGDPQASRGRENKQQVPLNPPGPRTSQGPGQVQQSPWKRRVQMHLPSPSPRGCPRQPDPPVPLAGVWRQLGARRQEGPQCLGVRRRWGGAEAGVLQCLGVRGSGAAAVCKGAETGRDAGPSLRSAVTALPYTPLSGCVSPPPPCVGGLCPSRPGDRPSAQGGAWPRAQGEASAGHILFKQIISNFEAAER